MPIINTTHGPLDEAILTKKTGKVDTERETTTWVEYWLKEELVHRSVHVELKETVFSEITVGGF